MKPSQGPNLSKLHAEMLPANGETRRTIVEC